MDFLELAASRCSTRSFKADPIPDEVINRILEAGRLAPSAKNLQPWRFTVVRTPAMLAKVHACYSRNWLYSAPAILIVSEGMKMPGFAVQTATTPLKQTWPSRSTT